MRQNNRRDALTRYVEFAFSELNKDEKKQSTTLLRVINVRNKNLRERIKQIEQHEAFYQLEKETRTAYGNGYHEYGDETVWNQTWCRASEGS